jgi:BTB/POZ domain
MDVTFSVKNEMFKANKFIVVSRCAFFKNYLDKSTATGICVIKDKRLTAEMFKCILTWIYW